MNPSFCANCGHQIQAGTACPACGSVPGIQPAAPIQPGVPFQPAQPQSPQYQSAPALQQNPGPSAGTQASGSLGYGQPPSGSNSKPAKTIFFILTGLTGLVTLAIAGVFVAGLFSGVDGALEKIGMECSPTTEEDWEDIEDPRIAAITKRGYNCELEDSTYQRINQSDYDLLLDNSLLVIIDSEEDVKRQLEECEDENSYANRVHVGNLVVGGYVFLSGGSYQAEQLAEALEAEGVDSEAAETGCERLAKSQK